MQLKFSKLLDLLDVLRFDYQAQNSFVLDKILGLLQRIDIKIEDMISKSKIILPIRNIVIYCQLCKVSCFFLIHIDIKLILPFLGSLSSQ